ncbi:MAG: tRNA (N6-isopentenyl adenosine(37)-C2)-methylthiotransferase MiaB [Bdellovibrionaceae bacterium]|jgi:tRNA-2-methylthio-N6-dimethylallyladenosine synthase|nr:tRNA (N6-isopentenyl adenosine(37)-C2)-methylthiotransferase MiaB [Pseudobdellovibrionaceae bacterium]
MENEAQPELKGVYISTYGCQMNVNDTERMYSLLEMDNYTPVTSADQARTIIINSCSVREKPVHKVRSEVGRYRKLKDQYPDLKIGVAGCVAQQEKAKLLKDIPMLDFVIGTDNIDELPKVLNEVKSENEKKVQAKFDHQSAYSVETLIRNPGIASFVNIAKGCDNFCTFCVVPFTRGRERSRTLQEVVADVQKLTERGVKEVTLLGQNVNSYLSSCEGNFAHLLKAVSEQTDIERIRYTTSHPKDFNEELVDVMNSHNAKVCEYIHLPVQSGNTEILARMNRGYSREDYLKKVDMIFKGLPNAVLSTDIIVGFPGETEAAFEDTLSLLDEVRYETIYAFKYSPRPFTKAARFTDQVPEQVKKDRLQRLFDKHNALAFDYAKDYENKVLEILVEEFNDGVCRGRSTQNKVVHFKSDLPHIGEKVMVKINTAFPQTLRGEKV